MKKFAAPKLQKENIIYSKIVEPLIIILISISFSGCSTTTILPQTPDYFAIDLDSHVPEIDRIALVTDATPPTIESIDLGVTQGERAGREAAGGAIGGAVYSLYLGPAYFIVLPYLVTAGAIGGAISGAAGGYSADVLEQAETQVEQILNSGYLQNKLLTKMEDYGGEYAGLEFIRLSSTDKKTLHNKPDYAAFTDELIDAVLEVELQRIALKKTESGKHINLKMNSRIRLISTHTGAVLSDNQYVYSSLFFKLEEWLDNDVALLSNEIQRGLKQLAEYAINENFLLFYPNIPDDMPMSIWEMSSKTPYVLNAIHPKGGAFGYEEVETLTPTLEWERFPREYDLIDVHGQALNISDVSYELKVFTRKPIMQVYHARYIPKSNHKIESDLNACSRYIWTVRARFKLNDRDRVTEWSAGFNIPGWNEKPWKLRKGKYSYPLAKHGREWFYYQFKTPCDSPSMYDPMQDE